MSRQHALVLPLPRAYASNEREHFSFFTTTASASDTADPYANADAVHRYVDDLCDLLRRTRLIQRHPDKYFQYVRGEKWRAAAHHLDGTTVTPEELEFTNQMCDAFAPLIDGGDGSLATIRSLLRDGPPLDCSPGLLAFYQECRRLMLHRVPRANNDSARFTLLQTEQQRTSLAKQRTAQAAQEARGRQILELVLSYGMNAKKQHEVGIMRDTIRDLVDCANTPAQTMDTTEPATTPPADVVRTVVNVGEGKGYVSRALALCDGLNVVGLDCNPAHRERAIERFETLVEGSLSLRPAATFHTSDSGTTTAATAPRGKDMISLLYEPRGAIASIACRVDAAMQWQATLQGHIPVVADGAPMPSDVVATDEESTEAAQALHDACTPDCQTPRKGECKVCHRIFPLDKTLVVMKHVHRHYAKELAASSTSDAAAAGLPPRTVLESWHRDLPQAKLQERLIDAFFVPVDVEARQAKHKAAAASAAAAAADGADPQLCASEVLPKRHRAEDVSAATQGAASADASARAADGFVLARVARGLRVVVLTATAAVEGGASSNTASPEPAQRQSEGTADVDVPPVEEPQKVWRYEYTTLTVVGRDDATGVHLVIYDEGTHKVRCLLVRSTSRPLTDEGDAETLARTLALPPAAEWAAAHKALLLKVREPFTVTVPAVRVPSLSNTVFIGLHTCGDLGSNTCRLFVQNKSRGMLLVSCCWHALTGDGFPLSHAFRARGMTTDKVSLLLATQPLDMWATASAEGHRSSARLLFFRTLLIMVWATLRDEWESVSLQQEPKTCDCPFAPEPHLEPGFLRRLNKVKETVSFPEFAEQVCGEYIYAETAKHNAYTWHGTVCASCRAKQEALFHARLQAVATALATEYMPTHFPRFLGLTVLRMWMCHLVESLFLLDRTLYLHEELCKQGGRSTVSLVPLFDGATSPRMYGILALRE